MVLVAPKAHFAPLPHDGGAHTGNQDRSVVGSGFAMCPTVIFASVFEVDFKKTGSVETGKILDFRPEALGLSEKPYTHYANSLPSSLKVRYSSGKTSTFGSPPRGGFWMKIDRDLS